MKLNLACGKDFREGYVNIDDKSMYEGKFKVDKQADVLSLEWQNDSVDEILCLHFAMYIHVLEMPQQLKKWFGWLKKGGKLVIETGDLKKICKNILETSDPKIINGTNGVMQLYGWETTAGHKWAWCYDTLAPLLAGAGFKEIGWTYGGTHQRMERDITITSVK
jgi:hypothetical protein